MIWPFAQQAEAPADERPFAEPRPSGAAALPAPEPVRGQTFDFEDDGGDFAAYTRAGQAAVTPASAGSAYGGAGASAGQAYAAPTMAEPPVAKSYGVPSVPMQTASGAYAVSDATGVAEGQGRAGTGISGQTAAQAYTPADMWGQDAAHSPVAQGGGVFKRCPQCGAQVFADMAVCFGCLYEFPLGTGASAGLGLGDSSWLGAEQPAYPEFLLGGGAAPQDGGAPGGAGTLRAGPARADGAGRGPDATGGLALDPGLAADLEEPPEFVRKPRHLARSRDGVVRVEQPVPRSVSADETAPLSFGMPRVQQVDGPVPERRWAVELRCGDGLLRCAVPEGGLRIGRDDDNDVVLPEQSVSRQHLRIVAGEGALVAQDLGATNPAQLNGVPLSGSARFGVGDTIDVCGTRLCAVCVG